MNNLNYGIIGNCRSGALVSEKGSIDWLCLPQFDSPSVFAKILDKEIGGHFSIEPAKPKKISQQYVKNTNILNTRFECEDGIFEVHDFMPRYRMDGSKERYIPSDLIRYFKHISGSPRFIIHYDPKLEYAAVGTSIAIHNDYIKSKTGALFQRVCRGFFERPPAFRTRRLPGPEARTEQRLRCRR